MRDFVNGEPTKRHKHRAVLKGVRKKDEWKAYQEQCKKCRQIGLRPPVSPIQKKIGARRIG